MGWRLVIRGEVDEGAVLVEREIARSANPPAWYYHPLAICFLMKGDGAGMLDAAQHGVLDGSARGQSFLAMAYGLLDDRAGGVAPHGRNHPRI